MQTVRPFRGAAVGGRPCCSPYVPNPTPLIRPSVQLHVAHGTAHSNGGDESGMQHGQQLDRRALMLSAGVLSLLTTSVAPCKADDFTTTASGLKYLDIRPGEGATPQPGDKVVVHWSGYTKGYQGKRIDNTSTRDEPYEFVLGSHQAITAFEEAVSSMRVGGIRRVEVPGERPELSYPRDRSERFTNELVPSKEGKIYRFRYGPQPVDLGGQRSLDFVLDNQTLNDLNRTLLFDIKLLAVRRAS